MNDLSALPAFPEAALTASFLLLRIEYIITQVHLGACSQVWKEGGP